MSHEEEVEQDLRHIHWSWPEAIAANPARSLATPDLAMDYFAFSPFFDTKSNNNVLRTQRRVENPTYGHAEEKVELIAFRSGFEYIVSHSLPPDLFVIHRRPVLQDGGRGAVTHAYFILQDKIYMSPNLHDVITNRLRNATFLLEQSFTALERNRPSANPRATSQWRAVPPSTTKEPDTGTGTAPTVAPTVAGTTTGTPAAATEDPAAAAAASVEAAQSKKEETRVPDWHLFHALAATRAALPELERQQASPAPKPDAVAEQRALEAAAQAAIGRPQPQANAPSAQAATPAGGVGTPAAMLGTPLPMMGTPAVGTPSSLRRTSNTRPGFSPRV